MRAETPTRQCPAAIREDRSVSCRAVVMISPDGSVRPRDDQPDGSVRPHLLVPRARPIARNQANPDTRSEIACIAPICSAIPAETVAQLSGHSGKILVRDALIFYSLNEESLSQPEPLIALQLTLTICLAHETSSACHLGSSQGDHCPQSIWLLQITLGASARILKFTSAGSAAMYLDLMTLTASCSSCPG